MLEFIDAEIVLLREDKNDNGLATSEAPGKIFMIVEAQPEFEGGLPAFHKYIMNEIRYPLKARQMGVEGQVDVQFVVGKDGSVTDVEVVKGISPECDAEAIRVVQSIPAFKPATQNGKPVNVRMMVPIAFKLNDGKVNPDNSTQGMVIIKDIQSINEKLNVDANYSNGEWSGTVYDEEGNGLPGVNIIVAGTTAGTRSGLDGRFKVKADKSQELNFSFVGYESVRLGDRSSVIISDQ